MARLYEKSARTDGVPSKPTKLPYRATDRACRANQTSVYDDDRRDQPNQRLTGTFQCLRRDLRSMGDLRYTKGR